MKKKYWAIYKPDADMPCGILLFKSAWIKRELWFVMVRDKDARYQHRVIKKDKNWVMWRRK